MNKVKNILLVVVLILCASVVYAKFEGGGFAPSSTGGTTYDGTGVNITATSANVTTLTSATANITQTLTANVLTVTGSANFAGATLTGITTDNSTSSHYLYKDAGGNVINATLGNGLSDSSGTLLTVADVAGFSWDGGASAIGANKMRCKVIKDAVTLTGWTLDAANAASTVIALYVGTPNADGTHVSTDATGTANITATTASYAISRDLSGWGTNTTIGANTEICANALSTTATWATLTLHGTR